MIDREAMATFLKLKREALQPEDVGLPRGVRRRTAGLRREEVAAICHISSDYYSRLERAKGPRPSRDMIASVAQGLHMTLDERDHLFRLAGHEPPARGSESEFVTPGMLRIFERLGDTPAEIVTELGETLRQTPLACAINGDAAARSGMSKSLGYRWFTDEATRRLYPADEHEFMGRMFVSGLREIAAKRGPTSRAAAIAARLNDESADFAALWQRHEVGLRPHEMKTLIHPSVGLLRLHCQTLLDPEQGHHLLVYTAAPGSESYEKLQLLAVVGAPASHADLIGSVTG